MCRTVVVWLTAVAHAMPVGYVARKFIDYFRNMVPQNMFSNVRTSGTEVQLVVISGLNLIDIAVVSE